MKFDAYRWNEVKTNAEIITEKGKLRLRVSAPCPLYITAQGYEALADYGTTFEIEVSEQVTYRIEAPKGVRAFAFEQGSTSMQAEGEIFTNIDRMQNESGTMLEVKKALRQFELEKRAILQDIRVKETERLAALRPQEPESIQTEQQPAPEGQPTGEAQ